METTTPQFDPVKYKNTTRDQWQVAAEAWYRWSPTLNQWLGKATDKMCAPSMGIWYRKVPNYSRGCKSLTGELVKPVSKPQAGLS